MFYIGSATKQGVFVVTFTFTDAAGTAIVPNVADWTLQDRAGVTMNGRIAVSITPASSVSITLEGNDLVSTDGVDEWRVFLVEYEYDSTEGTDLPMSGKALFKIVSA